MVPIEHKSIHLFLQSPKVGPPLIIEYTTRLLELGRMFLDKGAYKTLQSFDNDEPFLPEIYLGQKYTLIQWRALYFSSLLFVTTEYSRSQPILDELISLMRSQDEPYAFIKFIEQVMVELSNGHVEWIDKNFSPNNPWCSP